MAGGGWTGTGVSDAHLPAQGPRVVLQGSADPHLAWEMIHTLEDSRPPAPAPERGDLESIQAAPGTFPSPTAQRITLQR